MQEHVKVIEFEWDSGHRYWSNPMPESQVSAAIRAEVALGRWTSDIDCALSCWCTDDARYQPDRMSEYVVAESTHYKVTPDMNPEAEYRDSYWVEVPAGSIVLSNDHGDRELTDRHVVDPATGFTFIALVEREDSSN